MGVHFQPPRIDEALSEIESAILPGIGEMLEGVLEAAAAARGGVEPEGHGAELRRVLGELERVTRRMETLIALPARDQAPAASISA